MSEKFEVGDRVECIEAGSGCQLGWRGVVLGFAGLEDRLIKVKVAHGPIKDWYPYRFRKIFTNPLLESIYTYCRRELQS